MVAAAARRGYAYYAMTDHAPNLFFQRMTDEKMLAQRERVRAMDSEIELLHGTELNIAPDGSVDWDEEFLAGFDICVASVHSNFDQPRAEMTRRFVTACENPRVNIIGHPTTRRIGRRPPVDVDFGELFRACARTGTALEINASPQRLDLPSDHIRAARDAGVKFAIDSDAHSVADLGDMPYGVGTAQRGWLTPDDVINTWPLDRLRAFLRKGRLTITGEKRRVNRSIRVGGQLAAGGHMAGQRRVRRERAPSGAIALLASAIGYALGACAQVTPGEMALPTPCSDWDLEALLAHLAESMADVEAAIRTGCLDLDPSDAGPQARSGRRPGRGAARPGREPAVRVLRPPRSGPPGPGGRPAAGRRDRGLHRSRRDRRARLGRPGGPRPRQPDPARARHRDAPAVPAAGRRARGTVRRAGRVPSQASPGDQLVAYLGRVPCRP